MAATQPESSTPADAYSSPKVTAGPDTIDFEDGEESASGSDDSDSEDEYVAPRRETKVEKTEVEFDEWNTS